MERIVILGRGGAGKSTFARRLGNLTGIPVIQLDKHFWQPGLVPLSQEEWSEVQGTLASQPRWIMDGDLGPYDVLAVRVSTADTVLLLDFPLWLCLWRAVRRSRETWEFWRWLVTWRQSERPKIRAILAAYPNAQVYTFGSPSELERFLTSTALAG